MKKLLTIITILLVFNCAEAQYGYRDSNRIGIGIGLNQFTLNTSNFDAKPGTGWNGGFSMRGNFYNDFDMVYGIQFSENNFTVATTNGFTEEDVKYKLSSAQISLLLSYKFIDGHLSVEFGPMMQVNGKLVIDEENEDNIISGTTLTADQITGVSNFSFYPTIGITGGLIHLRASVMYSYGVTNLLGGLNDQGLSTNFKGHGSILSGSIIFYM